MSMTYVMWGCTNCLYPLLLVIGGGSFGPLRAVMNLYSCSSWTTLDSDEELMGNIAYDCCENLDDYNFLQSTTSNKMVRFQWPNILRRQVYIHLTFFRWTILMKWIFWGTTSREGEREPSVPGGDVGERGRWQDDSSPGCILWGDVSKSQTGKGLGKQKEIIRMYTTLF